MNPFLKKLLLLTIVLAVPIVPFLLLGEQFEDWVSQQVSGQASPQSLFGLVVAALAMDILLPIPSSMISTLAGAELGWLPGTIASWLGMTIGATLGFALSRRYGYRFAEKFSSKEELQQMNQFSQQYGPLILVLTRALPILAEASVLLFGTNRMSWRRFLPVILLGNLGISLAYAAFGQLAKDQQWLPASLGISIALPLLLTMVVRKFLPQVDSEGETAELESGRAD